MHDKENPVHQFANMPATVFLIHFNIQSRCLLGNETNPTINSVPKIFRGGRRAGNRPEKIQKKRNEEQESSPTAKKDEVVRGKLFFLSTPIVKVLLNGANTGSDDIWRGMGLGQKVNQLRKT